MHPCRNCLGKIFYSDVRLKRRTPGTLEAEDSEEEDDDDHGPSDIPTFLHVAISLVVMVGGFVIAFFVDNLQTGKVLQSLRSKTTD